ncbi:MAG: TonB-dependent receptor [Acidobacteriia bacterium]|nr:TonB-dependent receptor [Terriglobia bacterium]
MNHSQSVSKRAVRLFAFCILWTGLHLSLIAQTSVIEGQIKDPSGAVIRGAQISCIDALGTTLSHWSDGQGRFRFEVSAGIEYQLIVSQPGFSSGTVPTGPLKPGQTRSIEIGLQLSARTDSVLVSASLIDQPMAQVGSSVSIITGEDLKNSAAPLIQDALRGIPGLTVSSAGRRGGTTSIFARGGDANYDLVLLDGVKLNDFGGGLGYDFAHLVADDVDRIEVVRGAQSALYGSEAVGATLNVITQRGEGTPRYSFQAEGGSYMLRRWAAGANGLTRSVNWALNLSRMDSDGANFNDNYRDQNASGRIGMDLSPRTHAAFHFNLNANDAGAPGAYGSDPNSTFFGLDLQSRDKNNDYVYGLDFEHEFSSKFRQRFEGNFLSRNFRFLSPSLGDSFSDNFRGTLRSESDLLLFPGDTLAFGFEYQRERFLNNFVTDPTGQIFALHRNNFGYFAENQWNWQQRLFLTAGVRIENFRTEDILAVPFSHDQNFPASSIVSTNPRVSAAYFIRPGSMDHAFSYVRLHGSAGTGIRAPNGFELAFTSNPRLRPERSLSFDTGAEVSLWNSRALFDVTYFYNRFEDQIVTLTGDLRQLSTFSSDNLGNARAQGMEVSVTMQPSSKIRLGGQYTYLNSEILSLNGDPGRAQSIFKVGDPLIRRPAHSGSFFATWTHRRWVLSLDALMRGRTTDTDPNLGTFACDLGLPCILKNPGFVVANVGGSYDFSSGVTWYARINNLLNQRYEEVLGFPAYRLNFVSGVRVNLGGENGLHLKR